MDDEGTFSSRLRAFRKLRGLTQKELARRVFISHSYLRVLETQPDRVPSLDVAQRLAHELGVSLTDLAEGKSEELPLAPQIKHAIELLQQIASEASEPPKPFADSVRWEPRGDHVADPLKREQWEAIVDAYLSEPMLGITALNIDKISAERRRELRQYLADLILEEGLTQEDLHSDGVGSC